MVLADAGNENVGKAIVVVVAHGDAHAIHLDIKTGGACDIGEGAVAIVAVEPQRAPHALVSWPVPAVDEENVQPSIRIVVEESTAGAESFRQKLAAVGSGIVLELNAGGGGHVGKPKSQGRGLRRHARQDFRDARRRKRCETGKTLQEKSSFHEMFTRPLRMA